MGIRKPETISFWCGRLPHWEVVGGRYFITIHTAGAIPTRGQAEIRRLSETIRKSSTPNLQTQRKIFAAMEQWLDTTPRHAWLQSPAIAKVVIDALRHYQQLGHWNLFDYVVMPNHVHLFLELGKRGLKATIEHWKRWVSRQCLPLLCNGAERFWQREWFDHWSRSDQQDDRISGYIRNNPEKAGLVANSMEWPYGSWK